MRKTVNVEVRRQFQFQLFITILSGVAGIFKQSVCHIIRRTGDRPEDEKVPHILESYMFGGAIGWGRKSGEESGNDVLILIPAGYGRFTDNIQIGVAHREELVNGLMGYKKLKPQYIDAILNRQTGTCHVMRSILFIGV